jgi:catechol 2,3-dioxygenase-like lactoylglutathione lyase family enzyme
MPRFHHANLAVPPGLVDAEVAFLVDVLGYRRLVPPATEQGFRRWFEAEDGSQIHLSLDPDHRPAPQAHTAIEVDDGTQARLDAAGVPYEPPENDRLGRIFCVDPAGNRWELRPADAG